MRGLSLLIALGCVVVALSGCDDKKAGGGASSVASPAASTPPAMSAAIAAIASSAPPAAASSAPAEASSAGTSMITGTTKDVVLTVKDPTKEPEKSIKAEVGGTVTLFLPDYPGTVWSVDTNDKTLGKAKEEVIPGFAPGTNGHQFKWTTSGPLFKAGVKHKATFVNKKAGDKAAKPSGNFALTIEMT